MKRKALIVLIVFSTLDLFAQLDKGSIIFSADGNYLKTNIENGVSTNLNYTNGQYLNLGTSVGTFITNKLIVGMGLDYNWGKEIRTNSLYFNNFRQEELMTVKSNVILPNLYLGYYKRIADKLYFSSILRFSCGNVRSEYTTTYVGVSIPNASSVISDISDNYSRSSKVTSGSDYFGTEVCPELTYFVSKELGFCLGFGGVKYSMINWKPDNSNWTVNFNPNYWKLGIKIKLSGN